jgi:flotillin
VTGENTSRATMAESNAKLAEIQADARSVRRWPLAEARNWSCSRSASRSWRAELVDEIAPQEIEKKRIEIAAEAEAEKRRREAQGEADAILAKYEAEAKGVQMVLEAKAEGYRKLIEACGQDPQSGRRCCSSSKLPELVAEQVKAIQNVKIDKITVWDQGTGPNGSNATSEFLSGMVNVLPRLHELANQAGIKLPAALGKVESDGSAGDERTEAAEGVVWRWIERTKAHAA